MVRDPYPSCSGGSRSDRIVKGIFWTTELVSAFSTMPPRNMVKLFARACTTPARLWSAPGTRSYAGQAVLMVRAHS